MAHRGTWRPTLTAAAAAAGSYGSLLITEFRGFREFGIIGGAGMVICWVGHLPDAARAPRGDGAHRARLDAAARRPPRRRSLLATREGIPLRAPLRLAVARAPRLLARRRRSRSPSPARSSPSRYAATRSRWSTTSARCRATSARAEEQRLIKLAKEITGYVGLDGMAILVDRTEQVAPLKAALERRRDAAPDGRQAVQGRARAPGLRPRGSGGEDPASSSTSRLGSSARASATWSTTRPGSRSSAASPRPICALRHRRPARGHGAGLHRDATARAGASSTSAPPSDKVTTTRTTSSAGPTPTARPSSPTAASSSARGAR